MCQSYLGDCWIPWEAFGTTSVEILKHGFKFFDTPCFQRWGSTFLILESGWVVTTSTNRIWQKWHYVTFKTRLEWLCNFHLLRGNTVSGSTGTTKLEKLSVPRDHPSWAQPFSHPIQEQTCEWRKLQMIPSLSRPFESCQLKSQTSWGRSKAILSALCLNSVPPASVSLLSSCWLCC